MRYVIIASAITILSFAMGTAWAQPATPSPDPSTVVPEKTAPGTAPRTDLDGKSGALSDKLSDTKGVIRPTGPVDPAIEEPAPQAGSTPVIRPGDVGGSTAK